LGVMAVVFKIAVGQSALSSHFCSQGAPSLPRPCCAATRRWWGAALLPVTSSMRPPSVLAGSSVPSPGTRLWPPSCSSRWGTSLSPILQSEKIDFA
jgi:hypothetical protein